MSPEPPLRVLVIGLDPRRVPGPWDPEPVVQKVEAGLAKFAEHGVGVAACLVGLDDSDDVQAVIVAALKGHAWECVTIGGGMRHADNHVDLFEQVVNLVRMHAPQAAMAFNDAPDRTWEAASRWLRPGGEGVSGRRVAETRPREKW